MLRVNSKAVNISSWGRELPRECERADSYKFFSECYHLPDEKLIKMLNGLEKSAHWPYRELAESLPGIDGLELLRIDYSRLFVGPYKLLAPPYGSVYLEEQRRVMGDSTMDARNWYREAGLDIALKDAPDHITIELEFMCFLVYKEIKAIKKSDSEAVVCYLKKQKSFLETHLGRWVSAFAENVKANAEAGFYKNLGRLTESFIKEDLKSLSDCPGELSASSVASNPAEWR